MKPLTYDEQHIVRDVTIVGMRFYAGAFEYLKKASEKRDVYDQHLYLVVEANNEHDVHAIMLHNGRQKLGSVTSTQAPAIKKLMTKWRAESKGDDVLVCRVDRINSSVEDLKFQGSIVIHGRNRVNERLARKFADKYRKV